MEATQPPVNPSASQRLVEQTIALFVDAYRELNAKRLFWIVLIISCLIVAAFGAVGINRDGVVILWKTFPNSMFNTVTLDRGEVYKWMFAQLGVDWWLTFIAAILALVSTAGMFPDFLAGGAIDLYLSKPIGRTRLFLTKYLAGLMFVALQVLVFCIGAFVVIGLRGRVWEPQLFIAVPLVLLFFSYLFAVLVLLGVVTRSAIAALLLTFIFWIATVAFHSTEVLLLFHSIERQMQAQTFDQEIHQDEQLIEHLQATGAHVPDPASTQPMTFSDRQLQSTTSSLVELKKEQAEASDPFATWHRLLFVMTYPLPKSTETVDLIKRIMDERMHFHHDRDEPEEDRGGGGLFKNRELMRRAGRETQRQLAARSTTYILGTSLGFETVVLGAALWIFCRRDF